MGGMPPLGSPRFLLVLASLLLGLSPGSLLPLLSFISSDFLRRMDSSLVRLLPDWFLLCGHLCFPGDPVGLARVRSSLPSWIRLTLFSSSPTSI